jgi:hypothetical protein
MLFTHKLVIRLAIIALLSMFSGVFVIAYNLPSSPGRIRVADNTGGDKISLFASGDQGTGEFSQWKVALSMENAAVANHEINFVVLMGDNF